MGKLSADQRPATVAFGIAILVEIGGWIVVSIGNWLLRFSAAALCGSDLLSCALQDRPPAAR